MCVCALVCGQARIIASPLIKRCSLGQTTMGRGSIGKVGKRLRMMMMMMMIDR